MFIVANFLTGAAEVINLILTILFWLIIARAVLSWVSPDPYNQIVRFIYKTTEPILNWVRRYIPTVFGGIDFSPIVVILAIGFARAFLVRSLLDMATWLRN